MSTMMAPLKAALFLFAHWGEFIYVSVVSVRSALNHLPHGYTAMMIFSITLLVDCNSHQVTFVLMVQCAIFLAR